MKKSALFICMFFCLPFHALALEKSAGEKSGPEDPAAFVEFPKFMPFALVEDAHPGKNPTSSVEPACADASTSPASPTLPDGAARPDSAAKADAASSENWLSRASAQLGKRLKQIWHEGRYDLYLTLYTWHNPMAYDQSHRDRYNDIPWGGGLGKSFYDEDGDWHGLYAVAFSDSNYKAQIMAGYIFLKYWRPSAEDFRLGLGFTAGLTSKANYEYFPLPLAIPVVGVGYKNFDLQATYVPGTKNNGNVMFAWAKWRF